MVRLIVNDGGSPRAFKVSSGLLRVGSGADMKLRLASGGVAAHHADLQIGEDHVLLIPVSETQVDGSPVPGRTRVELGSTIAFGSATIAIESEAEAAAPAAPKRPVKARRGGGTLAARARREQRQGPSPAKILLMSLAGIAVLGGAFWFLFSSMQSNDPDALLKSAELWIEEKNADRATDTLARLPGASKLSAAQRARLEEVEDSLLALRSSSSDNNANVEGYRFFERKLERYRNDHLGEDLDEEKARLFLYRCEEFRRRWPRHPEIAWVEAEEQRLKPYARLDDPPRWEEAEWIVKNYTGGSPRRYREAFAELNASLEQINEENRADAEKLLAEITASRKAYFDEKRAAAEEAYAQGNIGLAVYWLIELVVNIGEPSYEDRAAKTLVKIPDVDAYLRTLRAEDPLRWRALTRNAVVQEFATQAGLL